MDDVAQAVTGLSTRWAGRLPDGSTAFSGLGVWPLLAILAAAADEPGRSELAAAAGVDPATASTRASELIGLLDGSPDLHAALGIWVTEDLKLAESFGEVMPPALRGTLSGDPARDKATLDGWVREHTGGLIDEMPLTVTPDLVLALASALSLHTTWAKAFDEDDRGWLTRTDQDLKSVRRYDDLTTVTVLGTEDVDVRLGLGTPDASAGQVVARLLDPPGSGADGTHLLERAEPGTEVGPGLTVVSSTGRRPDVQLSLPSFEVRADHDLMEHADLFGLTTVAGAPPGPGHFTRLSPERLEVSEARQSVYARFFATGFEAAAVTAVGMVRASMITPATKRLRVVLDRPFAFAAVNRPTGLPIVAGWVEVS
jgi:serine protease inhibitor